MQCNREDMERRMRRMPQRHRSTKKRKEDQRSSFPGETGECPGGLHLHPFHRFRRDSATNLATDFALYAADLASHLAAYSADFALRAANLALGLSLGFGFCSPLSRHDGSFLSWTGDGTVAGQLVPTS